MRYFKNTMFFISSLIPLNVVLLLKNYNWNSVFKVNTVNFMTFLVLLFSLIFGIITLGFMVITLKTMTKRNRVFKELNKNLDKPIKVHSTIDKMSVICVIIFSIIVIFELNVNSFSSLLINIILLMTLNMMLMHNKNYQYNLLLYLFNISVYNVNEYNILTNISKDELQTLLSDKKLLRNYRFTKHLFFISK